MRYRRKTEVLTGPSLKAEQVSEFWVWIWSAIDGGPNAEHRDEAHRLAVAFERAVDRRNDVYDHRFERFIRDQGPLSAALLAHYLLTRIEQWKPRVTEESRHRLQVLTEGAELLASFLALDMDELAANVIRLGVSLEKRSVFHPEVRDGVTIESLEEGPALPSEYIARTGQAKALCDAKWKAAHDRPKKRRQLTEVSQ